MAKFKVDEIKKQMKEQEVKDKEDLINSADLLVTVTTVQEFKGLPDTKKAKQINDLCGSIIRTPKTDLDKVEILIGIADNRIYEDLTYNKIALSSLTLIMMEITPEYKLRDYTDAEMQVKLTKEVKEHRGYDIKFKSMQLKYVKLLNTYLFAKDKEQTEIRLAAAICICKIFERLSHFNQAEEMLKLVIHIMFNFKQNNLI